MKLVYERPMMRAELFPAHAYCEEPCNWKLVGIDQIKNAILKATVKNWFSGDEYVFFFDAFSQTSHSNDGVANTNQHYFHEAAEYKNANTGNVWNGRDVREDGIDDSVYFLEWSNSREEFYVYQDMGTSGYYKGDEFTPGTGSLQVNGNGGNGGHSTYRGAEDYDTYISDKNVVYYDLLGRGQDASVSYIDGEKLNFSFSG